MMKQVQRSAKHFKATDVPANWSRSELNQILSISSKKFNPVTTSENKRCIELEHLSQETGLLLGYTNSNEQQSIKNEFEIGQILFGKLRPYLRKFWQASFNGVCSSEIWVLNGKKVKNSYLFYLIQTHRFNQITKISSGTKMPRADWNYMSEIPFDIPPIKEQEKIAEILMMWDEAITKQTLLIEQKQLFKKGLMQLIFSQEIRFKDENGNNYPAWQRKKLGDFKDIEHGDGDWILSADISENGQYKIVQLGNIGQGKYIEKDLKAISITKFNELNGTLIKKGDLLINRMIDSNNLNLCIFYKNGNFITSVDVCWIRENNYFINYFLMCQMLTVDSQKVLLSLSSGSGRVRISKKNLFEKFYFKLPSLPEQIKIANFLTLVDDEISKLTDELEQFKLQKKALMQKLLTGEIRVIT